MYVIRNCVFCRKQTPTVCGLLIVTACFKFIWSLLYHCHWTLIVVLLFYQFVISWYAFNNFRYSNSTLSLVTDSPEYIVLTPPSMRCNSGGGTRSITRVLGRADNIGACITFPKNFAVDGSPLVLCHASNISLRLHIVLGSPTSRRLHL